MGGEVAETRVLIHDHNVHTKMCLHRGWHSSDGKRPLENTRRSYQLAAQVGAAFAECDVWFTKDGVIVLSHDFNFKRLAADEADSRATKPISELLWDEVSSLVLKDGSNPVMLSMVLEDLVGTHTKLAIEMKVVFDCCCMCNLTTMVLQVSSPAKPLALFLRENTHLICAIGFIMSFSFNAVGIFHTQWGNMPAGATSMPRILWLVDHPSEPYLEEHKNEGETTFAYDKQRLNTFLKEHGLATQFAAIRCGIYLQYNPAMTIEHLAEIREDLQEVHTNTKNALEEQPPSPPATPPQAAAVFLGVWSDASLDPDFDRLSSFQKYASYCDCINTDMPNSFWDVN